MKVNPVCLSVISSKRPSNAANAPVFGGGDSFERSNKHVLTADGRTYPELDKWVEDYLKMQGASFGQIALLKKLFEVSTGDKDAFAKTLLEYNGCEPEEIVKDLREHGLEILSLDEEKLKTYNKNLDNFKNIELPENVDLDYFPLVPLLDEEQIKKVAPYCDDYVFDESFFDILNGDEKYFKRLKYAREFKDNFYDIARTNLSGIDFREIMHSDIDDETLKDRFKILTDYASLMSKSSFTGFYASSGSIKNLALAPEKKWETALYFINLKENMGEKINIEFDMLDELSDLDEEQLKKARRYVDFERSGSSYINSFDMLNIAKLDDKKFERALDYMERNKEHKISSLGYSSPLFTDSIIKLTELDEKTADFVFDNCAFLEWEEKQAYVDLYTMPDMLDLPLVKRIDAASHCDGIRDKFEKLGISDPYFDKKAAALQASLMGADVALDVPKANIQKLFHTFLVNIPQKDGIKGEYDPALTQAENVLVNSDFLIKSFVKRGLPLCYSRNEYIENLDEITSKLDKKQKDLIFSKLGIIPVYKDKKLSGYNGLLLLKNLNLNDSVQKEVYDITYKFLYSNRVETQNEELNEVLNSIIAAFPEFINSIGKPQNPTHRYSNDIHTLAVLNNCLMNPMYRELSSSSKTAIKLMALFHDLGKADGVVDKGHQNTSAYYVKSILEKLNIGEGISDRVFELVKNHHWFEDYNTGAVPPDTPAFMFRRPEDFKAAQIFARADLLGVGASMFYEYTDNLNPENMSRIQEKIDNLYKTGNAVYTTNVIVPSKIPLEKSSEGREYRVINFTKIPNDKDLYEYGFAKGTKKDDIRLLVHMIDDEVDLNRMRYLSDINNAGVLSETLISLDKQRTYCNRCYGVVLSNMPYNVIQMSDENIGSGTKKDFKYAIRAAQTGLHRDEFKKLLLAELGLEGKVSDDEYAEFYLKYLSNKNMLSQFNADREYKIGAHAVSSDVLRAAAARVMDGFIERSAEADTHSEFVAYNPKIRAIIAKENSLDDTPQYLKDYAFEHNLPIFLTGKP